MTELSRRGFLKALGWSAVGITAVAGGVTFARIPVLPPRNTSTPADATAWISLRPNGRFRLFSTRVEMGQGISIGLRQVAAGELSVELDRIELELPDTALIPVARSTVGSDAIRETGPLVAKAAAALRSAILRKAAERLRKPVSELELVADGISDGISTLVTFEVLGAGPPLLVSAEDIAAAMPRLMERPGDLRAIGRPLPTHDIDAIVTGNRPLYADDIRLDGMLFGAVVRPRTIGGQIRAVDASAASAVPGYIGLYREGDFIGIVARRRGALAQALNLLSIDEDSGPPLATADVEKMIDVTDAEQMENVLQDEGEPGHGPFDIDITLAVPLAAHASIEPRTAVARFADGGLEIWTGTQDPFFVRNTLAAAFGLSRENVRVHAMRIGGGFGARTVVAAELEAARLARLCGKPVKVQWSRRDEFHAGFHRPPSCHRIRAAADEKGRILRWHHVFRSGHVIFTSAAMGPGLQLATSFVADPGVGRGAIPRYRADATHVAFEDVRLPIKTGPWRGLGAAANHWAMETAIDALVRKKGLDPLAMRLAALPDHERLKTALKEVADMAGWSNRPNSGEERMGLACGIYKDMSYAAAIARVVRLDGSFRVTRLWCAHDCGLVINPDQVRAQIEGNLVWGIGMALREGLAIDDGAVNAGSFFDYAVPVLSDVPDIEIRLIEGSAAPTGAGETAIVCATAAITNAVAAITGQTVMRLPVRIP
nr:xanthine dehydrogenase family protein molybdopterin-binding subunit [arsenite-oxidising bacterium NT-25]